MVLTRILGVLSKRAQQKHTILTLKWKNLRYTHTYKHMNKCEMKNVNIGTQVKTGDEFGIKGWWINKNLNGSQNPYYVDDTKEIVSSRANKREIFVYFGENKPTQDEMRSIIESTKFIYPDAEY